MEEKKTALISKNTSYFLRGIAALMVILSHYFEWSEANVGNPAFARFMMALGDPGVGIFFFLSGYAIYKSTGEKKTDKTFLWKRFKAVYLPYLLISVVKDIYRGKSLREYDAKGIWELLKGGSFWYITVLLIIYLAFYFIWKLPKYRITILTLFIVDLSLLYLILGYQIFWYDANWAFALGLIVAKYEGSWKFVQNGFSLDIKDYVLCFLGKLSLYIYLLHGFIYLDFINSPKVYNTIKNWYVQLVLAILIVVLVSYITDLIFRWLYRYTGILWDKRKTKREVTQNETTE